MGLGSNVGDRQRNLLRAVGALTPFLSHVSLSSPYRSDPLHDVSQRKFLNAAILGKTVLTPEQILGVSKAIEWSLGRRPAPRYSPRPLDIDLLVFGDLSIERPGFVVPHPLLADRQFVLMPLAEIAPELAIPPAGRTPAELLQALPHDQGVRRSRWRNPPRIETLS